MKEAEVKEAVSLVLDAFLVKSPEVQSEAKEAAKELIVSLFVGGRKSELEEGDFVVLCRLLDNPDDVTETHGFYSRRLAIWFAQERTRADVIAKKGTYYDVLSRQAWDAIVADAGTDDPDEVAMVLEDKEAPAPKAAPKDEPKEAPKPPRPPFGLRHGIRRP